MPGLCIVLETDVLIANELAQAVYLLFGGHLFVLETEAPRIDQWCDGDVEGSICVLGNLMGQFEHAYEVAAEFGILAIVQTCHY